MSEIRWYFRHTDPTTGMRHGHIRWPHGTTPTPYGCRWCGSPYDQHGSIDVGSVGPHWWMAPTRQQQYARMIARRNARTTP